MKILGVKGHWMARAEIQSEVYSGEIPWDPNSVQIILEMEGFSLPVLEMVFNLYFDDYMAVRALAGRPNVTLHLGKDRFDFSLSFRVAKKVIIPAEHSYAVRLLCIAYPELFSYSEVRALKGTSVEVLSQVFSKYVAVENLSAPAEDSQTWIQVKGESNKSFIDRIWRHSYIPGSVLLLGFADKVRICDLATQVSTQKWKISNLPEDGFLFCLNSPVWQSSQIRSLNVRASDSIKVEDMSQTSFSLELPGIISSQKRVLFKDIKTVANYFTDNVHSMYFNAEAINYNRVASFISCDVEIKDDYYPFKPFDSVFLRYVNKTSDKEADPPLSGLYLIDRVVIALVKNQFQTSLKLIREDL